MVLQDKVVVITGVSKGAGRAVSLLFANRGAKLALVSQNETDVKEMEALCAQFTTESLSLTADLTKPEEIQKMHDTVIAKYGRADILVNNAGFGYWEKFENQTPEQIVETINMSLTGLILTTRAFIPDMLKQNSGQIVNVSSLPGKVSTPNMSVYSAAKAGVIGFSNSLRLELRGSEIDVISVIPGPMDTDFYSGEKAPREQLEILGMGKPEQVAEAIIEACGRRKKEVVVGTFNNFALMVHSVFPSLSDSISRQVFQPSKN